MRHEARWAALIVDDKVENLYLLEALLKGSGFRVSCARNGAQALELARKERPDIVISDILMPVMDGFALCWAWKRDARLREVPFVFYTATYTDPKDERLAMHLGADKFLIKPKDPAQFMELVRDVLASRESGRLGRGAPEETGCLKEYNEALARKLEKKVEELRSALADRAALLRELYHRSRNNMQLISSILELESMESGTPGAARVARVVGSRIQALSLISRKLYESGNLSRVDLKDYLADLAGLLWRAEADGIALRLELSREAVLIDTAVPCGLVFNELLSNALRYAFPGGRRGTVRVRCARVGDGELELSVADDGVGLPAGFDLERPPTLGLRLVKSIVEQQMRGAFELRTGEGLECVARFRDDLYAERV